MKKMGFKSYHYDMKGKTIKERILNNGFNGFPRFDFLSEFGEGVDPSFIIPFIEKTFPDAKFILTTREKESRMHSIKNYMTNVTNAAFNLHESEGFHDKVILFYLVSVKPLLRSRSIKATSFY